MFEVSKRAQRIRDINFGQGTEVFHKDFPEEVKHGLVVVIQRLEIPQVPAC
jgi:hypothetical protein